MHLLVISLVICRVYRNKFLLYVGILIIKYLQKLDMYYMSSSMSFRYSKNALSLKLKWCCFSRNVGFSLEMIFLQKMFPFSENVSFFQKHAFPFLKMCLFTKQRALFSLKCAPFLINMPFSHDVPFFNRNPPPCFHVEVKI